MKTWKALCTLAALGMLETGCSSIIKGNSDTITINSLERGTMLYVDGAPRGVDAASVSVKKGKPHSIRAEKEGCMAVTTETTEAFDATSLLGVFLDFGVISIPTDLISGAAWKVDQTTYTVTPICEKHAPFSPTPPSAEVWANSQPSTMTTAATPSTANAPVSSTDTQLRNAEREFRAGRMSLEEFRQIKKVLQPVQ